MLSVVTRIRKVHRRWDHVRLWPTCAVSTGRCQILLEGNRRRGFSHAVIFRNLRMPGFNFVASQSTDTLFVSSCDKPTLFQMIHEQEENKADTGNTSCNLCSFRFDAIPPKEPRDGSILARKPPNSIVTKRTLRMFPTKPASDCNDEKVFLGLRRCRNMHFPPLDANCKLDPSFANHSTLHPIPFLLLPKNLSPTMPWVQDVDLSGVKNHNLCKADWVLSSTFHLLSWLLLWVVIILIERIWSFQHCSSRPPQEDENTHNCILPN